jgi:hypothetical protein
LVGQRFLAHRAAIFLDNSEYGGVNSDIFTLGAANTVGTDIGIAEAATTVEADVGSDRPSLCPIF